MSAASAAYAANLKLRTSSPANVNSQSKIHVKPPKQHKWKLVDITFSDSEFPKLPTTSAASSSMAPSHLATTQSTTYSQTSTITPAPTFDYKAELERISIEIETKLKHQFANLFAQLETKLDNFIRLHHEQHATQEKVNENLSKQLGFIVDNMSNFLSKTQPSHPLANPAPRAVDGKA